MFLSVAPPLDSMFGRAVQLMPVRLDQDLASVQGARFRRSRAAVEPASETPGPPTRSTVPGARGRVYVEVGIIVWVALRAVSPQGAVLPRHVLHVLRMGPEEQVAGIAAAWVVAVMAHLHPDGNWANLHLVGSSRRREALAVTAEHQRVGVLDYRLPFPTGVGGSSVDVAGQSFGQSPVPHFQGLRGAVPVPSLVVHRAHPLAAVLPVASLNVARPGTHRSAHKPYCIPDIDLSIGNLEVAT